MFHRALLALAVACVVSTALPLATQAADSPAFPDACTAPTSTTAAAPAEALDPADRLFAPETENRVTPPKYGPCTMSFQCSSACGGQFISCSGQDYCEMNYGPRYSWCHQNIYVRCDTQQPIYCIGQLVP